MKHASLISALLLLVLLSAGCAPHDPLDLRIQAATARDYAFWLNDHAGRLSPTEQHLYDTAYREISLSVMTRTAGLSSDEQKNLVHAELDGLTVRAAIIRGCQLANERLATEQRGARKLLAGHEQLLRTPCTPAETRRLNFTIDSIQQQIATIDHQIAENQAIITRLSGAETPPQS